MKRWLHLALALVALAGLATAWWRYPAENHFSIMGCTISYLGSPDHDRNPHGWRFYQAGMSALLLLLGSLVAERHVRLRTRIGKAALWSTGTIAVSLALILLATWIPDSRQELWPGMRAGPLHTRMAILAIPFLTCGFVMDGIALWRSGVPLLALWPFQAFGAIMVAGTLLLTKWERMCQQDPTLKSWPGDGLYSTPLWEWIVFSYFVGFTLWMARGGPLKSPVLIRNHE